MFQGKQEGNRDLYTGFGKVKINSVALEEKNDKKFITFKVTEATGKFTTNLSFLVSSEENTSKSGKTQYIDAQGRTKWAEGKPESTLYFDANTAKGALRGEEDLVAFIAALVNVEKGETARFDDFKAITRGNLAEIEEAIKAFPNNKVGVAVGIRNGKYQTIYSRKFVRGWAKDGSYLKKELEKDTYNKDFYGTEFTTLTVFDPSSITPNDEVPAEIGGGELGGDTIAMNFDATELPEYKEIDSNLPF